MPGRKFFDRAEQGRQFSGPCTTLSLHSIFKLFCIYFSFCEFLRVSFHRYIKYDIQTLVGHGAAVRRAHQSDQFCAYSKLDRWNTGGFCRSNRARFWGFSKATFLFDFILISVSSVPHHGRTIQITPYLAMSQTTFCWWGAHIAQTSKVWRQPTHPQRKHGKARIVALCCASSARSLQLEIFS